MYWWECVFAVLDFKDSWSRGLEPKSTSGDHIDLGTLSLGIRFTLCCWQNSDPQAQDVQVLTSRICQYISLHGKRELRLQMELEWLIRRP